jgi:hypothetical protein
VVETGENHQCGVNDLGITRDNYQQVEKHTLKHNSVKIEGDEGGEPNVALVEGPPDGGAPNAAEEEGAPNALEGPPDEEASTQVGVSDLEGEVSEPDTEGDGRDTSRRLAQLISGTPGRDSGISTNLSLPWLYSIIALITALQVLLALCTSGAI